MKLKGKPCNECRWAVDNNIPKGENYGHCSSCERFYDWFKWYWAGLRAKCIEPEKLRELNRAAALNNRAETDA